MLQLLVTGFVAGFIGIAALGHVLLVQAIFAAGTDEPAASNPLVET